MIDEQVSKIIMENPEQITKSDLPNEIVSNDLILLKENVLSNAYIYRVTDSGIEKIEVNEENTELILSCMKDSMIPKINCGFDMNTEYECITNLLQNGIIIEESITAYYKQICNNFGYKQAIGKSSGMQMMARINMITEDLSQNNRELIREYIFRTGNFEKAEKYAEKIEKESGIIKNMLQEIRLVDSYKYMLWTIVDYENSSNVSQDERITTGAINESTIPILNEKVNSLEQIDNRFIEVRQHSVPYSEKYYAIVRDTDDINKIASYKVACVSLYDYVPEVVYANVEFESYDAAKDWYNECVEDTDIHLVEVKQAKELIAIEKEANKVELSDITSVGRKSTETSVGTEDNELNDAVALELIRKSSMLTKDDYDNVFDTLKAAYVSPDKYCYIDYDLEHGTQIYTVIVQVRM